jgi:hypothetical protein
MDLRKIVQDVAIAQNDAKMSIPNFKPLWITCHQTLQVCVCVCVREAIQLCCWPKPKIWKVWTVRKVPHQVSPIPKLARSKTGFGSGSGFQLTFPSPPAHAAQAPPPSPTPSAATQVLNVSDKLPAPVEAYSHAEEFISGAATAAVASAPASLSELWWPRILSKDVFGECISVTSVSSGSRVYC